MEWAIKIKTKKISLPHVAIIVANAGNLRSTFAPHATILRERKVARLGDVAKRIIIGVVLIARYLIGQAGAQNLEIYQLG